MQANEPLFYLEDQSPVYRGDTLHVDPRYISRAGDEVTAEWRAEGYLVIVRSRNGAVPTLPVSALTRTPHPRTVTMRKIAEAMGILFQNVTERDIRVWEAAVASLKAEQATDVSS